MFATLFQAKGLSCRVTSLRSRDKCNLNGPCSYTQPSKLEHPGPPLSHSLEEAVENESVNTKLQQSRSSRECAV